VTEFACDGENALLVEPEDPAALARAIGRLAFDVALRARLSEGGRATSEALAWTRIAPQYEQLYLDALACRGR
jgi:glycosyltransferase involved in cell wall biosynthesis